MDKLRKTIYTKEYHMLLERLKNRREELGISQDKLSQLLGRTRTFVSKAELGERRLDILELMHYLEMLQLDPKQFFNDYFRGVKNLRNVAAKSCCEEIPGQA
ncbi:MAG: helix-turn-helix domain-containing protein [Puniceicoccales bacterium]|jgi:transcriptional regulator with XRE-family HTH domain|nr:helix-turn-helix domain-containing protein [Puniceicoccales bacterium]